MATTISNGESGSSVRTKLNNIWEGLQINEISETISDTAVDVFVYDTRKDSDGGAWRKRTQHTSWYNETLNTSTRGSRKEFPAVAVIVAESNTVTIYDGDDPDLPMWMVFNKETWQANNAVAFWGDAKSISMMNGHLSIGHSDGVARYWFLNDNVEVARTTNYLFRNGIAGRNTRSVYETFSTNVIVNNSIQRCSHDRSAQRTY